MISASVDQKQLDRMIKELRKIGHIISSPNLQLYRANKFKKYTIEKTQTGELGLTGLSGATKIIAGDHKPESNAGGLLGAMSTRSVGKNAAEAGYFAGSSNIIPGKKITYAKAAVLQHTGYRIKLTGEKGSKARMWVYKRLEEAGYFPISIKNFTKGKSDDKWFIVPARPFVFISADKYIGADEDVAAADEFIDKMMNSPIEVKED